MTIRKSVKNRVGRIANLYIKQQKLLGQLPNLQDNTLEYASVYGEFLETTIQYHDQLAKFNETEIHDGEKQYFEDRMNTVVDKAYIEQKMSKAIEKIRSK